jgi:hypothetical protein
VGRRKLEHVPTRLAWPWHGTPRSTFTFDTTGFTTSRSQRCCPTRYSHSSMLSSSVANSRYSTLQPSTPYVTPGICAAHTNKHRHIFLHLPSSMSTAWQRPARHQSYAPTSTSPAFHTQSSTSANASPRDTSSSAWSHRPWMRSTNTTMRRSIDDRMRARRT